MKRVGENEVIPSGLSWSSGQTPSGRYLFVWWRRPKWHWQVGFQPGWRWSVMRTKHADQKGIQ